MSLHIWKVYNLYRSFSWYNISFDPYYNPEAKSDISLLILKTRKARPKEKLFPKNTQTKMKNQVQKSFLSESELLGRTSAGNYWFSSQACLPNTVSSHYLLSFVLFCLKMQQNTLESCFKMHSLSRWVWTRT